MQSGDQRRLMEQLNWRLSSLAVVSFHGLIWLLIWPGKLGACILATKSDRYEQGAIHAALRIKDFKVVSGFRVYPVSKHNFHYTHTWKVTRRVQSPGEAEFISHVSEGDGRGLCLMQSWCWRKHKSSFLSMITYIQAGSEIGHLVCV
jgi:hypothetical protein